MARRLIAAVLTLVLLPLLPATVVAEDEAAESKPAPDETKPASSETTPAADETKSRDLSFAIVPGPFYKPNLGLGINVIPMLMFHCPWRRTHATGYAAPRSATRLMSTWTR